MLHSLTITMLKLHEVKICAMCSEIGTDIILYAYAGSFFPFPTPVPLRGSLPEVWGELSQVGLFVQAMNSAAALCQALCFP